MAKRSARSEEGVVVVEGERGVLSALEAPVDVEAVFAGPAAPPAVLEAAEAGGVAVHSVADGVIAAVADTQTPQETLAVVRFAPVPMGDAAGLDWSLTLVLAEVRDPGNAGTLVRTAEAAGASAVVFARGSADATSPKVVRAAAGALFHVPIVSGGGTEEVLDVLAQQGVRCLGTSAQEGEDYLAVDWSAPTALVLGNEAWGLPPAAARAADGWVTIPMAGRSESLNVAAAAAVLLFAAARSRG